MDFPTLLFLFLDKVVIYLDAEDDATTDSRDKIGDEKRPQDIWLVQDALEHKTCATYSHHKESGQCYTIRVPCANGLDGLGQIAKYHGDAGCPSQNLK